MYVHEVISFICISNIIIFFVINRLHPKVKVFSATGFNRDEKVLETCDVFAISIDSQVYKQSLLGVDRLLKTGRGANLALGS